VRFFCSPDSRPPLFVVVVFFEWSDQRAFLGKRAIEGQAGFPTGTPTSLPFPQRKTRLILVLDSSALELVNRTSPPPGGLVRLICGIDVFFGHTHIIIINHQPRVTYPSLQKWLTAVHHVFFFLCRCSARLCPKC